MTASSMGPPVFKNENHRDRAALPTGMTGLVRKSVDTLEQGFFSSQEPFSSFSSSPEPRSGVEKQRARQVSPPSGAPSGPVSSTERGVCRMQESSARSRTAEWREAPAPENDRGRDFTRGVSFGEAQGLSRGDIRSEAEDAGSFGAVSGAFVAGFIQPL